MTYLVLRRFRSYGKMLTKGMLVEEVEIRSPRLRYSEGKIIPAVSSSTLPEEPSDSPVPQEESIKSVEEPAVEIPAAETPIVDTGVPDKPKITFKLGK